MGRLAKWITVIGMATATASPASGGLPPERAQQPVSVQMAAPWLAHQRGDGGFHGGWIGDGSAYGDSMLGYGLLQAGLQTGDRDMQTAGLRALGYAARRAIRRGSRSAFENLALAGGFNLARVSLPRDPEFQRVRPAWTRALRRIRARWSTSGRRYFNKYLVEAVATLELAKTGLRSSVRGSVLSDRWGARRRAAHFVNRQLAASRALFRTASTRGRASLVLSDPPWNPIAYHALSLGMLGRAVDLLGRNASPHARATLRRVAYASWGLMAPDGDVAYYGRSQEQAWALGLTAFGARTAARFAPPAGAARLAAVARRALERLAIAHPIGSRGIAITPALADDPVAGWRGLDGYANRTGYAGLSLVAANWAVGAASGPARGRIASDRVTAHVVGSGAARLAVVRRGPVWFAVKQSRTAITDLRYDFGLVAMKAAAPGPSGWRDVVQPRPYVRGRNVTAGPVLHRRGRVGYPVGTSISAGRGGWVTVRGGYQTAGGAWLRAATFRFRASGRCVAISFRLHRGERVAFSTFLSGLERRSARGFNGGGARVTLRPRATRTTVARGYASGAAARLIQVKATLAGPAVAVIRTCPDFQPGPMLNRAG